MWGCDPECRSNNNLYFLSFSSCLPLSRLTHTLHAPSRPPQRCHNCTMRPVVRCPLSRSSLLRLCIRVTLYRDWGLASCLPP